MKEFYIRGIIMSAIQNVPAISIAFMIVSLLVSFSVPIILVFFFLKKKKADLVPFFIGCGIFAVFALILEGLLHLVVLKLSGSIGKTITGNVWLYGIYGGLAAGIFEETGRFIAFKKFFKKYNKPQNALMYGAGHGGFEAMVLIGFSYVNNILISFAINSGNLESFLGDLTSNKEVVNNLASLATIPSIDFLAAGIERIIAITLHISLSVLVYIAVTQKGKWSMYIIAILLHAAINFVAVILMNRIPIIALEAVILALVVMVAFYARKLYKQLEKENVVE